MEIVVNYKLEYLYNMYLESLTICKKFISLLINLNFILIKKY
jgi:hypothetical protein